MSKLKLSICYWSSFLPVPGAAFIVARSSARESCRALLVTPVVLAVGMLEGCAEWAAPIGCGVRGVSEWMDARWCLLNWKQQEALRAEPPGGGQPCPVVATSWPVLRLCWSCGNDLAVLLLLHGTEVCSTCWELAVPGLPWWLSV